MRGRLPLFFRRPEIVVPRFFYCAACGFRLVLEDKEPKIPKCEHCGSERWHSEPHQYLLNYMDRRLLKSMGIAPDDVPIYREKNTK